MKSNFKRFTGILLAILMVVTMLPSVAMAEVVELEDSPNYLKVVADNGTIKEYLYHDTIVEGGKTYIGLIGATDIYNWGSGNTGPNFRPITDGVDFEGVALPEDGCQYLSTNLTHSWNSGKYNEIHTKISMIPSVLHAYMLKYAYDLGTYGAYNGKDSKSVGKLSIASKDEIDSHLQYLLPVIKNEGSYGGYITTRTAHGGHGYYRYSVSNSSWLNGNTWEYPYGSTFVRMYVDADMLKHVKLDTTKMGNNVKDMLINSGATWEELRAAGYASAELISLGFTEPVIPVTGVTLDKTSHTMTTNETVQLTADVLPLNQVADDSVTWTTDDDTVATVVDGLVTAVGFGTATITATSNADNNFSATCTITVAPVDVSSVILDITSVDLGVDNTKQLTVTVEPANATSKDVTWSSDNTAVATVDQTGLVTAIAKGVATITVSSVDDNTKYATCEVRVVTGPIDSPNYIEVISNDGTIKEYLYNDTITQNGKTYIGLIGAKDIHDWDTGMRGPNFRAITTGVDFEGEALPEDSYTYVSTNLTTAWNSEKYNEIHTQMAYIPTQMHSYLLKYAYDCGTNSLYGGTKNIKTIAKLTAVSKDEVEAHKIYIKPIAKTGTDTTHITTRTGNGGNGFYRYSKDDDTWAVGNTYAYPYGSTFIRMYVDADMFKDVKVNVNTLGSSAKNVLANNFTKSDLEDLYTVEELEKIGIPEDYVLEVTNNPTLSQNMSVSYKLTNNRTNATDMPVILAVAYNNKGNVLGAKHVVPAANATLGTTPATGTVTIVSSEVPAYAVVYALKSLDDATSFTKNVVIGTNYTSTLVASAESAELKFALNANQTEATFTVSGTLADGKEAEVVSIVTKPGKTLADLATATDTTDVILNVNCITTDAEGKYAYDFTTNTDDLSYDIYGLSVYYGATSPATDTVVYSDSGFDTVVTADFTGMTMEAFFSKYSSILPLDNALLGLLNTTEIAAAKAAVTTINATATSIADDINSQMATQLVIRATTGTDVANVIATYNNYIGLNFVGWLNALNTTQQTELYDKLATDISITSTQKLVESYEKNVMLILINNVTKYDDIEYILITTYSVEATKYGLDLTKFNTYGSDLTKALAREINSQPFADWASLKVSYDAYNGEGAGGGSSGGGGGGGGSSTKPVDATTLVQFTPGTTNVPTIETPKAVFDDLGEAKWASVYIESLAKLGYVNGKNANNFCPNDNITREEVIKILVSALKLDLSSTKNVFADANPSAWYTPYLIAAYENGITNGSGDGRFGVGANITREELATMIYRASNMAASQTDVNFADEAEISDWASEAVVSLTAAGVLNGKGDNMFAPKANATRAEAAKIIYMAIVGK